MATRTFRPYTKAEIIESLQKLPEDATIDDAMEWLYVMAKITGDLSKAGLMAPLSAAGLPPAIGAVTGVIALLYQEDG